MGTSASSPATPKAFSPSTQNSQLVPVSIQLMFVRLSKLTKNKKKQD